MKSKLLYERALITCVIMLIVCVILKLFGVPWFNLDTSIPILNKINNIVMNSIPLSFVYSVILITLNNVLITSMIVKEKRTNFATYLIISFVLLCITTHIKLFCTNNLRTLIDFVSLYICFIIRYKDVRISEYIKCVIINVVYQMISLFIRGLSGANGYYGLTQSLLLNLDYYIILVLHVLYVRKGGNVCTISLVSFSSLANLLWRKPTQNSNQCSSKEMQSDG